LQELSLNINRKPHKATEPCGGAKSGREPGIGSIRASKPATGSHRASDKPSEAANIRVTAKSLKVVKRGPCDRSHKAKRARERDRELGS
jgi:hypothetical protein